MHILFSTSAAGVLRDVLRSERRQDQVICLWDNLSYGPIASLDPDARYKALSTVNLAGEPEERWLPRQSRLFWRRCASTKRRRLLWLAPRSPAEMCGYLAYMHRFGDRPCEVVNLDELSDYVRLKNGEPWGLICASGILSEDNVRAVMDRARPVSAEEANTARSLWEKLAREDAMLRVPAGDGVISVSERHVDECFVTECSGEWKPTIRVLADVLGHLPDRRGFALDQNFLEWRLDRLLAEGILESREDASQQERSRFWAKAWIRRPAG